MTTIALVLMLSACGGREAVPDDVPYDYDNDDYVLMKEVFHSATFYEYSLERTSMSKPQSLISFRPAYLKR